MVENYAQSRDLFCEVLTSAGYAVRVAPDELNAIRHMEETRFDVVLTDISMPQMDGLELLTSNSHVSSPCQASPTPLEVALTAGWPFAESGHVRCT